MAFYVKIIKQREYEESVVYNFFENIDNFGTMTIHKETGIVELNSPIKEDSKNHLYLRAAAKIRQEWQKGCYPEVSEWAS